MSLNFTTRQKAITAVFSVILILFIASAIASPLIVNSIKENWTAKLTDKIDETEKGAVHSFEKKQKRLLDVHTDIKDSLEDESKFELNKSTYFNLLKSKKFNDFKITISSQERELQVWNQSIDVGLEKLRNLPFNFGETFFIKPDLITYLSVLDSVKLDSGKTLYISTNSEFEKKYKFQNEYFQERSFEKELSENFDLAFEVKYSEREEPPKAGQKHTFLLRNNFNNKIGVIVFQKPFRDMAISKVESTINDIQKFLVLLLIIGLGVVFYPKIRDYYNYTFKTAIITIFLVIVRVLLFDFNFPSKFIDGKVVNPEFFSSIFAFGMVRSPLELFITLVFGLVIALVFIKSNQHKVNRSVGHTSERTYIKAIFISVVVIALFLLLWRGFGASVKSMVFDSTLNYFSKGLVIPDFTTLLMILNLLLLGSAVFLISIGLIYIVFRNLPDRNTRNFWILFGVFQIAGILFDIFQKEPQGSHFIRVLYILFLFAIAYLYLFNLRRGVLNYVTVAFGASVISISLLNYSHLEAEKQSLKTVAYELTRPDENLFEFLVKDAIVSELQDGDIYAFYKDRFHNYDAAAFSVWSKSGLKKELVSSQITFFDENKNHLGDFGFKFDEHIITNKLPGKIEGVNITNRQLIYGEGKLITGIAPIIENNKLHGFIKIDVVYDYNTFVMKDLPPFISKRRGFMNLDINYDELNIYDIQKGKLQKSFGDLIFTSGEVTQIANSNFDANREVWLNLQHNDDSYLIFALNERQNELSRIIAVGLNKKKISWNLFDFFSVFFVHTIFILLFLLVLLPFMNFKTLISNIRYSYRTQLLLAILIISIIPLILLAVYFRNLTEDKNKKAIIYKLRKRAVYLEDYANTYYNKNDLNLETIFDKAHKDLELDFSVYDNRKLFYSSHRKFNEIGLLQTIINSDVYHGFQENGRREFLTQESIEKYRYNADYYQAHIGGKDYIIKVDNAFNYVTLPMSGDEVDIFLFGSYSLAVILIIIFSTILSNQISKPVRRLTMATNSVAGGDLNIEIRENYHGEVRELVDGFNYMVKELKRNQVELRNMEREAAWRDIAKQVAHEIKNPLTPMRLSIQQLVAAYEDKSPKFNAIFDKVTQTLIKQIDMLKNIASEFSSFARMPNIKLEVMDLKEVVNDTINLFSEERVNIWSNIDGAVWMKGDKEQFRRIMINLFRNAVQANADKISIELTEQKETYDLFVMDNGDGIPKNVKDDIFKIDVTTKDQGMGLGLTMAKRYMDSVGGSIQVKNTSKDGTTIQLRIKKNHKL